MSHQSSRDVLVPEPNLYLPPDQAVILATCCTAKLPCAEITKASRLLLLFLLSADTISTCQSSTADPWHRPRCCRILLRCQILSDRYLFFTPFPFGISVLQIRSEPRCPILFTFRLLRRTLRQGFFRLVLPSQLCLQTLVVNLEWVLYAVKGISLSPGCTVNATHTVIPSILMSSRGRSVPLWLGSDSMAERTVSLSINLPNTVCLPLRCGVARNVKKNWLLQNGRQRCLRRV